MNPHRPWWQTSNRTILVVAILLCVAVAIGGAYFLGFLDQLGLLHEAPKAGQS
jgi:hypothetical protein